MQRTPQPKLCSHSAVPSVVYRHDLTSKAAWGSFVWYHLSTISPWAVFHETTVLFRS